MEKRQTGPDILRCLALFFVNGVHSFLYNGFYNQPQTGSELWLGNCLRWLCFGCIGIFLMLTGYLKSQKKPDKQYFFGLVPILVGYTLTCIIAFPIRHFLLNDKLTLWQWIDKFFSFGNYAWYVEMYIGLILVSPVINLALQQLKTTKQLLIVAAIAFCVTALPGITNANWIPNYWTSLYPFTYYILGAVIRRLQPKLHTGLGLAATAAWVGIMGLLSLLLTDKGFNEGLNQGYGGFWVTIMVVLLFMSLYHVELKGRSAKVLAWMAGGCFEGYLLSRLLDVWIYGAVPQWHNPKYYLLILLCITVPVFLFSILSGKAVHGLTLVITKPLAKRIHKVPISVTEVSSD